MSSRKPTKSKKPAKSKVKRRKRAKKPEPYTGGGTWHPPGMGPTGRPLPTPKYIRDEQW